MLEPGATLQRGYVIEKVLGQGGMGAVYLARQSTLQRRVAIKETTIRVDDPALQAMVMEQFQKEAEILASIDHPNLVDVKDYFEENGSHYMVMAFIDGETLEDVQNRSSQGLQIDQVLGWMDQLCDVLTILHEHAPPVIVRDLKPSNLMVDHHGRLRLIDFGIARVEQSGGPRTSTFLKGSGTVGFAPMEQFGGEGTDARTDIYALGATIYNLLTRAIPPWSMHLATGEAVLHPPSSINPAVSPQLDAVIMRMMALRRDQRFSSVREVRRALQDARQTVQEGAKAITIPRRFCMNCGTTIVGAVRQCMQCGDDLEKQGEVLSAATGGGSVATPPGPGSAGDASTWSGGGSRSGVSAGPSSGGSGWAGAGPRGPGSGGPPSGGSGWHGGDPPSGPVWPAVAPPAAPGWQGSASSGGGTWPGGGPGPGGWSAAAGVGATSGSGGFHATPPGGHVPVRDSGERAGPGHTPARSSAPLFALVVVVALLAGLAFWWLGREKPTHVPGVPVAGTGPSASPGKASPDGVTRPTPQPTVNPQAALGTCQSNLKNIATAVESFSTDNAGKYPSKLSDVAPKYLGAIPSCPAAEEISYQYQHSGSRLAYTVTCAGWHHKDAGIARFHPLFDSFDGLQDHSPYLDITPADANDYFQRGFAYYQKGDYGAAISDLTQASARSRYWAWPLYYRGLCFSEQRSFQRAVDDFTQALSVEKNADFFVARAEAYASLGEDRNAIKDYVEADKLRKNDPDIYIGAAFSLYQQGKFKEAIDLADGVLKRDLHHGRAYVVRYWCELSQGKGAAAATDAQNFLSNVGWKDYHSPYSVIAGYLAYKMENRDSEARGLAESGIQRLKTAWPYPCVQYLGGEMSEEQLLGLASGVEQQTEAQCYVGIKAAIEGRKEDARKHLEWVRDKGYKPYSEYRAALSWLARL